MTTLKKTFIYTIFLLFALSFNFLYVQEDVHEESTYISFLSGNVNVDMTPDNNIEDFEVAKIDMKLYTGTIIHTGASALCEITMSDGSTIRISRSTMFQVEKSLIKRQTGKKLQKFKLFIEEIRSNVQKPISNDLEFDNVSGTALAGIRG